MNEQWVIVHHFPRQPTQVYGTFASWKAAFQYAAQQGFECSGSYEIHKILNVEEELL